MTGGTPGRAVGGGRVGVAPGPGLVARFGSVVVLLADASTAARSEGEPPRGTRGGGPESAWRDLLALVEEVGTSSAPGRRMATRIAGSLLAAEPSWPESGRPESDGSESDDADEPGAPFGLVVALDDGWVVLLRGAVKARISGADGVRELSGSEALTWVDQVVRGPVDEIRVALETQDVEVDPRSDLRAGTVPGSGFGVRSSVRADEPSTSASGPGSGPASSAAAPASEPVPNGTSSPAREPQRASAGEPDATADRKLEPTPAAASTPNAPARATAAAPAVQEPASPAPTQASPAPVSSTPPSPAPTPSSSGSPTPTTAAAPPAAPSAASTPKTPANATVLGGSAVPVGVLVSDDGPRIVLDRNYVLGRDPHSDPTVRAARASPIIVDDPAQMISRVHAYVDVVAGVVSIRDAASVAGTFLAAPGAAEWTRLGAEATPLPLGWSLLLGTRVFTYAADEPATGGT